MNRLHGRVTYWTLSRYHPSQPALNSDKRYIKSIQLVLVYLINSVFDFNVEKLLDFGRADLPGAVPATSVVSFSHGQDRVAAAAATAGRRLLLLLLDFVFQGGQDVAQRSGDGLGGERQSVARLFHRVQNVEEPRVSAALQLPDAVSQHLGNGFLPARFVQLVGRPLIEQKHGRFLHTQ